MKKVFWGMVHPFSFMKLEWPKYYQKRGCMFFQTVWHSLVNENLGSIDRISLSRFPEVSPMHTARDTVLLPCLTFTDTGFIHIYMYICIGLSIFLQWLPLSWRQALSFGLRVSIPRTCHDALRALCSQVEPVPRTRAHVRLLLLVLYPPDFSRR